MSVPERKFKPTVDSQKQLKVQVPHTPEGREFLEKLKDLLSVEHLPFAQSCPPTEHQRKAEGTMALSSSGSTTYALDIRLEQEGWPP